MGELAGGRVDEVADGIDGIMRHGEGFDGEVANLEAVAGLEYLKIERALVNGGDFLGGMGIGINGNARLGREHAQTADVIGMFVRDEDAIEPFGRAILLEKRRANTFGAQAAIDEQPCAGAFEIGGVAR